MFDIERIRKLAALHGTEKSIAFERFRFLFLRRYFENDYFSDFSIRYEDALSFAFSFSEPFMRPNELICANSFIPLDEKEKAEYEENVSSFKKELTENAGVRKPLVIDLAQILSCGLDGIIEGFSDAKYTHSENSEERAARITLEVLLRYTDKFSSYAGKLLLTEQNEKRKNELRRISMNFTRSPHLGAESFYEAVQTVLIVAYFFALDPCAFDYDTAIDFGTLDCILAPYFDKDVEEGKMDVEFAHTLINLLAVKLRNLSESGIKCSYSVSNNDGLLGKMLLSAPTDISSEFPIVKNSSIPEKTTVYFGITENRKLTPVNFHPMDGVRKYIG